MVSIERIKVVENIRIMVIQLAEDASTNLMEHKMKSEVVLF